MTLALDFRFVFDQKDFFHLTHLQIWKMEMYWEVLMIVLMFKHIQNVLRDFVVQQSITLIF